MRSILALFLLLAAAAAGYAVDTMPKVFDEIRDRTGTALAGARVQVTLTGTGTLATLYADDESTTKVNPLTTDSHGAFQYKASPGVYDLTISWNGQVIDVRTHIPMGNLTATVSSVALTMPSEFTVTGSPITTGGTLGVTLTSPITAAHGGTGQSSYAVGDLLYASGATAISKLADVATGNVLISGGLTTAPSWGKVALTTHVSGLLPIANGGTNSSTALSGSSLMISDGTHIVQGSAGTATTLLHGNASGAPTYSAASLTADVTGLLPVANGGTNSSTALSGSSIMISDGTHIVQGTAGTTVTVLHGNASGSPTYGAVSLTADVSGVTPIANGGTNASTAATARTSLGVSVGQFNWQVEAPTAKTYTIVNSSEVALTVSEVICATTSGTCTLAFKINGTNITGLSAVAVTSTPATTAASAANSIAVGDALTVVASSISSPVDLVFTVKTAR